MGPEISRRNFTALLAAAGTLPVVGTAAARTQGGDNRAQSPAGTTSPTAGAPTGGAGGGRPAGDPRRWSAADLAAAIAARQVSAREATESVLARLNAVNPRVNAVAEVLEGEALAAADETDRAVRDGAQLGPLHGVPITTKINVDLKGHATTNGVVAFKDRVAAEDSAAVANLRSGGAIIVGRSNVPAFSFRWFSDNDLLGQTLNP